MTPALVLNGLRTTPDPVVRTSIVGYGIWELRSRMESGAAKVVMPVSLSEPLANA